LPVVAPQTTPNVVIAQPQWSIGWRAASKNSPLTDPSQKYRVWISLVDAANQPRRYIGTDREISLGTNSGMIVTVQPNADTPLPPELQGFGPGVIVPAVPSEQLLIDNEVARYLTAHPDVLTTP
jgi:hypothetical protein